MPHILIVEDDPGTQQVLATILKRHGYDVASVDSGPEAIALARRHPPDLILLDQLMPEMSGVEACTIMRAEPGTRDIPIIMLTALSALDEKIAAFDAGVDDYVTKPAHKAELLSRINAHLTRRSYTLQRMKPNHHRQY